MSKYEINPECQSIRAYYLYLLKEAHYDKQRIPEIQRALIYAIYFEQVTEKEYGEIIGLSQAGVGKKRKNIVKNESNYGAFGMF